MYRRSKKYQQQVARGLASAAARERERLNGVDPCSVIEDPPALRRVMEITDYDSGEPIHHRFELYRCDRLDCYNVVVDGELWKQRVGWSRVLEGLRKALPRIRQR